MKFFPAYILVFFASVLLSSTVVQAQSAIPVSTNDNVTTTIFFPSNIGKVISPAVNFNFQFEPNTRIGLLKGRRGKPSNLLVITEDGYAYSFALSYSEEVQKFNFILTTDQAVSQTDPKKTVQSTGVANRQDNTGPPSNTTNADRNNTSTNPTKTEETTESSEDSNTVDPGVLQNRDDRIDSGTIDTLMQQGKSNQQQSSDTENFENEEDDLYNSDREEYYRIFCENNYLQKTILKRSFRQNKKIAVRLNNIMVDRNEKYFVLQIENNSRKDFNVDGLGFFRKTGVGQIEKIMTPLYTFNLQDRIDPQSVNEVVYVFKNFDISSKERINIVLTDANSENGVVLSLDNLLINSASN